MDRETPLYKEKYTLLRSAGLGPAGVFPVSRGDAVNPNLVKMLRISRARPEDFSRASRALSDRPVSLQSERLLWETLGSVYTDLLDKLGDETSSGA